MTADGQIFTLFIFVLCDTPKGQTPVTSASSVVARKMTVIIEPLEKTDYIFQSLSVNPLSSFEFFRLSRNSVSCPSVGFVSTATSGEFMSMNGGLPK